MSEFAPSDAEQGELQKKKPIDALVVFGFGITSDSDLERMKMGEILKGHPEKGWRLPLGARLRVLAAAELYAKGEVNDVIFTGGQVKKGEGINASEAQLMKQYFEHSLKKLWTRAGEPVDQKLTESQSHILLEDKATNTIENFAYTINYLEANKDKYQNIGLLSNNFHIDRIVKLAQKLQTEGQGIGAESTIQESVLDPRLKAIDAKYFNREENDRYREEALSDPDLTQEGHRTAEARLGTSIADYERGERRWSRGLDEIPEYWLQNVAFIKNDDQLKTILKAEQGVEENLRQYGVENIDEIGPNQLRQILSGIERKMPPVEWGEKISDVKTVIFSDVDGTLLEPGHDESEVKEPIVNAQKNKDLITLTSSRTSQDLERLQARLGIGGAIICENGAAIKLPKDLIVKEKLENLAENFEGEHINIRNENNGVVVEFGQPLTKVIKRFNEIRNLFPGRVVLTPEMSVKDIMHYRGFGEAEARDYFKVVQEEYKYICGFVVEGEMTNEILNSINEKAQELDLKISHGGQLWHLMSNKFDKGKAVRFMSEYFRSINSKLNTIGIGNADNDLEMLKDCDQGYLVGDVKQPEKVPANTERIAQNGPEGWSQIVGQLIENERNK